MDLDRAHLYRRSGDRCCLDAWLRDQVSYGGERSISERFLPEIPPILAGGASQVLC